MTKIYDVIVGRRGAIRCHGGSRPRKARPRRGPSRSRRSDQALRRRHSAKTDRRLRDPGQPPGREDQVGAGWCRPHTGMSTSRSKAASSAWSIATFSTNGCGSEPLRAALFAFTGTFERFERDRQGRPLIHYRPEGGERGGDLKTLCAQALIGADGARSKVGRQTIEGAERTPCVFAYHEIIKSPEQGAGADFDGTRCDVIYNGDYSPDFYSWVFPHGGCTSIGTGSANKGFSLRGSVEAYRSANGMADCETIRKEGAPIPLKPLPRWDNGRGRAARRRRRRRGRARVRRGHLLRHGRRQPCPHSRQGGARGAEQPQARLPGPLRRGERPS